MKPIAILAIVLVVMVALGAIFLMQRGKNAPAQTSPQKTCYAAGETMPSIENALPCCQGLNAISVARVNESGGCDLATGSSLCTNCGNGVCNTGENKCNCQQDCGNSSGGNTGGSTGNTTNANSGTSAVEAIASECNYAGVRSATITTDEKTRQTEYTEETGETSHFYKTQTIETLLLDNGNPTSYTKTKDGNQVENRDFSGPLGNAAAKSYLTYYCLAALMFNQYKPLIESAEWKCTEDYCMRILDKTESGKRYLYLETRKVDNIEAGYKSHNALEVEVNEIWASSLRYKERVLMTINIGQKTNIETNGNVEDYLAMNDDDQLSHGVESIEDAKFTYA